MNKRYIAVMALSLVATNAFASRARNLVSGTGDGGNVLGALGTNGSFYTNDDYNIFYNPSQINNVKNFATLEKSARLTAAATGNQGTGGVVTDLAGMKLGVFFNRDNAGQNTSTNSKPIDLILGGDMGVKWGVGVRYDYDRTVGNNNSNLGLNLGAQVAGIEPFVGITLKGTDGKAGTAETKYSNTVLGARYHFGEWLPYVVYNTKNEDKDGTATDVKTNRLGFGLGRMAKVSDSVSMNYAVSYWTGKTTTGTTDSNKISQLPINMLVSAEAASWITVFGGLEYLAIDNVAAAGSNANATRARVGTTMKFGKLELDAAIGGHAANPFGDIDAPNVDAGSGTLAALSATYRF